MSSQEDGARAQQQQQQSPEQPEISDEERDRRFRETLHGDGRYVRDAEYVRELFERHPELLRRPDAPSQPSGLNRFIDARLPLWGVISAGFSLALVLVTMWFNVQTLTSSMQEMQRLMRENANSFNSNDREVAKLTLRMEAAELAIRETRARVESTRPGPP